MFILTLKEGLFLDTFGSLLSIFGHAGRHNLKTETIP